MHSIYGHTRSAQTPVCLARAFLNTEKNVALNGQSTMRPFQDGPTAEKNGSRILSIRITVFTLLPCKYGPPEARKRRPLLRVSFPVIGNFGLSERSSGGGTSCRIVGPVSGNGDLGQNYLLSLAIVYSPVVSDLQRKRAIILSYIPVAITRRRTE